MRRSKNLWLKLVSVADLMESVVERCRVSSVKGIEHLKKEAGNWKKRTCWMNLQDVFGGRFSYIWFSPFHATSALVDTGPPEICIYSTL